MRNGLIISKSGVKEYYKDDVLHRIDGPAVETPEGEVFWAIDGEFLNPKIVLSIQHDPLEAIYSYMASKYDFVIKERLSRESKHPVVTERKFSVEELLSYINRDKEGQTEHLIKLLPEEELIKLAKHPNKFVRAFAVKYVSDESLGLFEDDSEAIVKEAYASESVLRKIKGALIESGLEFYMPLAERSLKWRNSTLWLNLLRILPKKYWSLFYNHPDVYLKIHVVHRCNTEDLPLFVCDKDEAVREAVYERLREVSYAS